MTSSATLHLLVDLENVQPSPGDVEAWLADDGQAWVFYGPHQLKRKADFELNSPRSTLIPISRSGANSLDFHLVFYLGYLAAKYPKGRFVVLAKDKGYDPPIVHARTLAFSIKRMKALPATATKKVTTGGATAKDKPSKPPTSALSKQDRQAKPSKPVAAPKKKMPRSAIPAKQQASAAGVRASTPPAPAAKKRSSDKLQIAMYRDLLKDLGAVNRPKSLSALKHHIQTKFGPVQVPHRVEGMIDRLLTSDVIHLVNNKLGYGPPTA